MMSSDLSGPHHLRGPEVRRVTSIEEVGTRAVSLALFLERCAQVIAQRLDVDGRDAEDSHDKGPG